MRTGLVALGAATVLALAVACGGEPTRGGGVAGPPSTTSTATTRTPTSDPSTGAASSSAGPPATSGASPRAAPLHPSPGRSAWVRVSVATLWRTPSAPRAVDAPALRAPADVRGWLAGMTVLDRRGLVGRADTQALLGDRVVVTQVQGAWARVVVPDQPTPLDRRGYPGWLPLAQLSATAAPGGTTTATVVRPTTWLRTDTAAASPVVEVGFGTRLPVTGTSGAWVRVALPGGGAGRVARSAVAVRGDRTPALPATGESMVRSAQAFTGLPYLWAGRSGFGLDCSGLTSLVHRVHGVTIPRDADAQAVAGRAVAAPAPGDLLFYATATGYVHHVAMAAGGGLMVQAPATGRTVETVPTATAPYAAEYAGARRYLP